MIKEEAVENAEAIAAVDDVDVLSVGMSDLARSVGLGGEPTRPRVAATWERVAAAARQHGEALRIGGG